MKCPNCGNEWTEELEFCPQCGNPVSDERPWDKKAKKKTDAELQKTFASEKPAEQKPRVVKEINTPLFKAKVKQPVNDETYLDHAFVIATGLCGYSANPENPEKLESGTVILTKEAVLLGKSEYDIRCARFQIEIPVDIIEYFTEDRVDGKTVFALHTVHGQDFYIYVAKRKEWVGNFGYVLNYVPNDCSDDPEEAEESVTAEKGDKSSSLFKWLKVAACVVPAIVCFLVAAYVDLSSGMEKAVMFFGFFFLVVSASMVFKRKED